MAKKYRYKSETIGSQEEAVSPEPGEDGGSQTPEGVPMFHPDPSVSAVTIGELSFENLDGFFYIPLSLLSEARRIHKMAGA